MSLQNNVRRSTYGIASIIIGIGIGKVFTFYWRSELSISMGQLEYSDFILFFVIFTIISQISFGPLGDILSRDNAFTFLSVDSVMSYAKVFALLSLIGVACAGAIYYILAISYGRLEILDQTLWLFVTIPTSAFLALSTALFRSVGRHMPRALFMLAGIPLVFSLLLMLLYGVHTNNIYAIFFVSYVIITVFSLAYLFKGYNFAPKDKGHFSLNVLLMRVRKSAFLFYTQLLDALFIWIDTIIVGYFFYAFLGTYSNASAVAKIILIPLAGVYFVMLPVFSRLIKEGDKSAIKSEYKRRSHHIILLSMPVFCILFFNHSILLELVFNIRDAEIYRSTELLLIGYYMVLMVGPISPLILAMGKNKEFFNSSLILISVNSVLSFILIPLIGVEGAAIAATVCYLLSVLYLLHSTGMGVELLSMRALLFSILAVAISYGVNYVLLELEWSWIYRILVFSGVVLATTLALYWGLLATISEKTVVKKILTF